MGNIYKHSVFMISADNCRDSQESVLENRGSSKMHYVRQGCVSSKSGFRSIMYSFGKEQTYLLRRTSSVLGSRAWALQEQVLSPRTLHWTSLQLEWTCRTMTRTEQNPSGSEIWPRYDEISPYPTKTICLTHDKFRTTSEANGYKSLELWYYLVEQFSGRKITFEEDSFPAISGLAQEVNRLTDFHYKAGLWAEDIHNGLLWYTEGDVSSQKDYVAPSWSWAAMRRGVTLSPCPTKANGKHLRVKPLAKIINIHLINAKGDEFGTVKSGKLRINAPFKVTSSFENNQIRYPANENAPLSHNDEISTYELFSATITCWLRTRK